ncbi:MAG: hypothetical protein M1419_00460 [Bacteroidetes bacterium]|nr:hypothetical protein [Bacteroidota bacterium]
MSEKISYRDMANINWKTGNETYENIQLGCLLKIADNIEKMAHNYTQLISERNRYKEWYEQERKTTHKLYRSISALRGVITKMKKKAGEGK